VSDPCKVVLLPDSPDSPGVHSQILVGFTADLALA